MIFFHDNESKVFFAGVGEIYMFFVAIQLLLNVIGYQMEFLGLPGIALGLSYAFFYIITAFLMTMVSRMFE